MKVITEERLMGLCKKYSFINHLISDLKETLEDKVFKLQSQMIETDIQMEKLKKRLDSLENGFRPFF